MPEIKAGLVKINSIVREAGFRTKLAVSSEDPNVDAVGSCIGNKGVRVNAVVAELGGEKIDVIEYCDDPIEYIARALSPAQVLMVSISEEEKNGKSYRPRRKTFACNRQKRSKRSSCGKTYRLEDRRQTVFYAQNGRARNAR